MAGACRSAGAARAGLQAQPVPVAAELLGLSAPHTWQERAAAAVADGRDTLLVARPGSGGSTAGLLAGLATGGRTLWVSPMPGARSPAVPAALLAPEGVRPAVRPAVAEPGPVTDRDAPGTGPVPLASIPLASTPLARPPEPADLLAMQAESAPAEFFFRTADSLRADDLRLDDAEGCLGWGLLVVDRAAELSEAQAAAVRTAGGPAAGGPAAGGAAAGGAKGRPPVLVVVDRADPQRRAALVKRFDLVDPVWVGGGWDPGSELEARVVATQQAARSAVEALIRARGAAVVVAPSRGRAERLVAGSSATGWGRPCGPRRRCARPARAPPWAPGEPVDSTHWSWVQACSRRSVGRGCRCSWRSTPTPWRPGATSSSTSVPTAPSSWPGRARTTSCGCGRLATGSASGCWTGSASQRSRRRLPGAGPAQLPVAR